MQPAFDTLNASKRLRDAGLEERAAEAIVELVQSATHFPDISGLATKTDLAEMMREIDLANLATKTDLTALAHTAEMNIQPLKADLAITKTQILVELSERLRSQS